MRWDDMRCHVTVCVFSSFFWCFVLIVVGFREARLFIDTASTRRLRGDHFALESKSHGRGEERRRRVGRGLLGNACCLDESEIPALGETVSYATRRKSHFRGRSFAPAESLASL